LGEGLGDGVNRVSHGCTPAAPYHMRGPASAVGGGRRTTERAGRAMPTAFLELRRATGRAVVVRQATGRATRATGHREVDATIDMMFCVVVAMSARFPARRSERAQ
jgi:hypothetical protein